MTRLAKDLIPAASAYSSTDNFLAVPSGQLTVVTFDAEEYDDSTLHSTGSNTSRMVADVDGAYLVKARLQFEANGAGNYRQLLLRKTMAAGGTLYYADPFVHPTAGDFAQVDLTEIVQMLAGDYIEVQAYQDSGGALNLRGGNVAASSLRVARLGALA